MEDYLLEFTALSTGGYLVQLVKMHNRLVILARTGRTKTEAFIQLASLFCEMDISLEEN